MVHVLQFTFSVTKHRKWKKLTIKSKTWQFSPTTGARLSVTLWHWSTRRHWGIQRQPRRLPNQREKTSKMPGLWFHNINTPTVSISLQVCSTAATMCKSIFSMNVFWYDLLSNCQGMMANCQCIASLQQMPKFCQIQNQVILSTTVIVIWIIRYTLYKTMSVRPQLGCCIYCRQIRTFRYKGHQNWPKNSKSHIKSPLIWA